MSRRACDTHRRERMDAPWRRHRSSSMIDWNSCASNRRPFRSGGGDRARRATGMHQQWLDKPPGTTASARCPERCSARRAAFESRTSVARSWILNVLGRAADVGGIDDVLHRSRVTPVPDDQRNERRTEHFLGLPHTGPAYHVSFQARARIASRKVRLSVLTFPPLESPPTDLSHQPEDGIECTTSK